MTKIKRNQSIDEENNNNQFDQPYTYIHSTYMLDI